MAMPRFRLPKLWKESGLPGLADLPDVEIRSITDDSREVQPGTLFVAVKGAKSDGHRFLAQAIAQGAGVVLVEEDCPVGSSVVKLTVPSTRKCLGPLAHTFYGRPSHRLQMVGITGTNGKTTVAWLVQHLLRESGMPCGLIGTVCYQAGGGELPSQNTTPGVLRLQKLLQSMVQENFAACSMEVSSHALDQHRTDGIRFRCGVFTNLSPEHLDYHPSLDAYLQAKARLFEGLDPSATAVINCDDPAFGALRRATRSRVRTFGFEGSPDFTFKETHFSLYGTKARLVTPSGSFALSTKLIGRHNLENLLAALLAVDSLGMGISLAKAVSAVESFPGVPGRLEQVAEEGSSFPVFVDYAHTECALRRVLGALRAVTRRKIVLVFGCGGDRDRTKRPRMGVAAAELADLVYVTSDNPRSEDPETIAAQVALGFQGASIPWSIVLDRREAIRRALESADEKWLVLIAGKGHETGQIVKDQVLPFDDRVVAREFLKESEQVVQ